MKSVSYSQFLSSMGSLFPVLLSLWCLSGYAQAVRLNGAETATDSSSALACGKAKERSALRADSERVPLETELSLKKQKLVSIDPIVGECSCSEDRRAIYADLRWSCVVSWSVKYKAAELDCDYLGRCK